MDLGAATPCPLSLESAPPSSPKFAALPLPPPPVSRPLPRRCPGAAEPPVSCRGAAGAAAAAPLPRCRLPCPAAGAGCPAAGCPAGAATLPLPLPLPLPCPAAAPCPALPLLPVPCCTHIIVMLNRRFWPSRKNFISFVFNHLQFILGK